MSFRFFFVLKFFIELIASIIIGSYGHRVIEFSHVYVHSYGIFFAYNPNDCALLHPSVRFPLKILLKLFDQNDIQSFNTFSFPRTSRIRAAHNRASDARDEIDSEMSWDDSSLTITVNPLEVSDVQWRPLISITLLINDF